MVAPEPRSGRSEVPGRLDERTLVERARASDPAAITALYELYVHRIHDFAYRRCLSREVAEDVTAATFERALRSLDRFRWQGGGFGPWLFRIAANEVTDHFRRTQVDLRKTRHLAGQPQVRFAVTGDAGEAILDGDGEADLARLHLALSTLRPRYQEVISARYLSGLSADEAAASMGCSKPVLAVTLHRALQALRRAYVSDVSDVSDGTEGGR